MKNTHAAHIDYDDISTSLNAMKELAIFINKKREEAENIYHIMSIQDRMIGKFEVRHSRATILTRSTELGHSWSQIHL